ncbi:MAG TPA: hypothetical protein VFQ76_15555 [Longimicrobiaceae bacterium]|nr:hypothetical protein [Longimicrobiaceae bacterium]
MRKKLIVLSALTCLVGGGTLLAPASSQGRYPSCEYPPMGRCAEGNIEYCAHNGEVYRWDCFGGTWYLSPGPI